MRSRLRKSQWFYLICEALLAEGFTPGGRVAPGLVSSYCLNGVCVEVLGGHTLRMIYPNGGYRIYEDQNISKAKQIISDAAREAKSL
jgi:hypothetical protein